MTLRLSGKTAFITGAARGLGAAIARRFAQEGAQLVLTDIDQAALQLLTDELSIDNSVLALQLDVTDEQAWLTSVAVACEHFSGLHILVNNAGIILPGHVENTSLDDWRKTQAVNLDGVFLGTQAAVKVMKQGGSIINISSIEGIVGEADACAYNASKGGVRLFTKSAALHCAKEGYPIRVNSVHPGFIFTQMVADALQQMPDDDASALRSKITESIPVGHMGEPLDIANACLFLASDESRYMTGSELVVDGGFTAR